MVMNSNCLGGRHHWFLDTTKHKIVCIYCGSTKPKPDNTKEDYDRAMKGIRMATLIFKSWDSGGTGITNFDLTMIELFREAVRQYGDPNLVVSDQPMPPMTVGGSLHDTTKVGIRNISTFWKIYNDLETRGWKKDPAKDYDRAMKGIK